MIFLTSERYFANALLGQRNSYFVHAILPLLFVAGCGGGLIPFIPSVADLQAFDDSQTAFNEQVDSLPSINVRIINETSALARIELVSGLAGPVFPEPEGFEGLGAAFGPLEPFLEQIDFRTVLVASGGTVTGTLKCGEVIAVSANAPGEQVNQESFGFGRNAFGLFTSEGNIAFSGIGLGTDAEDTLAGDVVFSARFIQPEIDNVDCATDTLVIRVMTPGSVSVYDSDTGQLVVGASHGDGILSLE